MTLLEMFQNRCNLLIPPFPVHILVELLNRNKMFIGFRLALCGRYLLFALLGGTFVL
jgi:hypothetical protein